MGSHGLNRQERLTAPGRSSSRTRSQGPGTLGNWSLNITPGHGHARQSRQRDATTFTIGFPQQQLSGTYTVQLGPSILDTFGQQLDTNQNAGLDVLRGQSQNGPDDHGQLQRDRPAKRSRQPRGQSWPGDLDDQRARQLPDPGGHDLGSSGHPGPVNITYPNDPDLTATLVLPPWDSWRERRITLFSGVGNGTNTANFTNTVFDDNAATPIQTGDAPFFGTFNPQQSLVTRLPRARRPADLDAGHPEQLERPAPARSIAGR